MSKWEIVGLTALVGIGGTFFWLSQLDWDSPGVNSMFGLLTGATLITFGVLLGAAIVTGSSLLRGLEDRKLMQQDQNSDIQTIRELFRAQNEYAKAQGQLTLAARRALPEPQEDVTMLSVLPGVFDELEEEIE